MPPETTGFHNNISIGIHYMLQVTAGVSRKVGLPNYSSTAATCSLTAECESALLDNPARMQRLVRRIYRRCETAVSAELKRQVRIATAAEGIQLTPARPPSSVTPRQSAALRMLANRNGIDLGDWLREHGIGAHEECLTRQQASRAIRLLGRQVGRARGSLADVPGVCTERAVVAAQH